MLAKRKKLATNAQKNRKIGNILLCTTYIYNVVNHSPHKETLLISLTHKLEFINEKV